MIGIDFIKLPSKAVLVIKILAGFVIVITSLNLYFSYLNAHPFNDKIDPTLSDSLICVAILENMGYENVSLDGMAKLEMINGKMRITRLTLDARGLQSKEQTFQESVTEAFSQRHVRLSGISSLQCLKSLRLHNVYINKIPSEIGKLVHLEYLEFENAGLDELPDELGNLSQLRALFLGYNNIKRIPNALCGMKKLETLSITGNPLAEFPSDVTCLISLHDVFIDQKYLDALPSQLKSNAQTR